EAAAAVAGHRLEQLLVEVVPDPQRAGDDAAAAQLGGVAAELARVDDPDVGEAVGQQQDAVELPLPLLLGSLLTARQPATREVRAAAGLDRADRAQDLRLRLRSQRRARVND